MYVHLLNFFRFVVERLYYGRLESDLLLMSDTVVFSMFHRSRCSLAWLGLIYISSRLSTVRL